MKDKTVFQINSHLEMVGFLKSNGTQCRFVSIITDTEVKNIRAACPYKGVRKISDKRGMINVNYAESVRRKIAAALGLKPAEIEVEKGTTWYKHLQTVDGKPLPVVVNKKTPNNGEYYLQYFPTSATSAYQMPDGTPVPEDKLKAWFYERGESFFKPNVISVNVCNIKKLAASGVIMQAEDLDEAEASLAALT